MEVPLLEEIKPLYVLMRRIRCLPQQGVLGASFAKAWLKVSSVSYGQ